jgi:hypothetical protein
MINSYYKNFKTFFHIFTLDWFENSLKFKIFWLDNFFNASETGKKNDMNF